jgi:glutaredoxin
MRKDYGKNNQCPYCKKWFNYLGIASHAPFAIGINAYTYLPNFRIEKRKELNVVEKKRIEEHNNEVSKRKENRE